jgi:hypothetical protein
MKALFKKKRNLVKKILFLISLALLFSCFNLSKLFAANIYVDKSLTSDCIGNNYSISNHNCSGSDGKAYNTIQKAISAMSGSDDIYIRDGTYNENVTIPQSKNGSSSKWSTIQSYIGEWAILNGNHNAPCTIGYFNTGSKGANDIKYWIVQRLEITGGAMTDAGGGFCGNGGPFIIRYCYIHDNKVASNAENPGGIYGYCWKDSTIEYNWFNNNGGSGGDNGGDISIYADYRYKEPGVKFNTGTYYGYYRARNEIKYNYFQSGVNGVRQKSIQDMSDGDFSLPNTYQTWGEKIHHNIFGSYGYSAIQVWGDFTQVYNNISVGDGASIQSQFAMRSYTSGTSAALAHVTFFNNTAKGAAFIDYAGGADTSDTPRLYWYNNISDNFARDQDDYAPSFHITAHTYFGESAVTYPPSRVTNNYAYRPQYNGTPYRIGGTSAYRSAASFNSAFSGNNYQKASSEGSDNLYVGPSGANQYITRGAHVISGSTTIANGGTGGNHPYLAGVTLPSYVGATDPNDPKNNAWVQGVLGLSNVEVLKISKGVPEWVTSIPRIH